VRRYLALGLVALLTLISAACGGGTNETATPEDVEGDVPQETVGEGDAAAGEEVYNTAANPACGSCHTYGPAGSSAEVGPNLDDSLEGQDKEQVYQSIVNPDAEIAEGFQPGIMPKDYGEKLDDKQLADLVAFLLEG
jgi:mono/diheme cytochrome c family protein